MTRGAASLASQTYKEIYHGNDRQWVTPRAAATLGVTPDVIYDADLVENTGKRERLQDRENNSASTVREAPVPADRIAYRCRCPHIHQG